MSYRIKHEGLVRSWKNMSIVDACSLRIRILFRCVILAVWSEVANGPSDNYWARWATIWNLYIMKNQFTVCQSKCSKNRWLRLPRLFSKYVFFALNLIRSTIWDRWPAVALESEETSPRPKRIFFTTSWQDPKSTKRIILKSATHVHSGKLT